MKNEPIAKKPVSPKKQLANRRNAQKSTGPKSPEGKRRSARNAVKHGLLSRDLVVTTGDHPERPEDFRALLADLQHEFAPTNVIDRALVERVASCLWRLARAHRFEAGAIRQHLDESVHQERQARAAIADLQNQRSQQRDRLELARDQLQFLQSLTDRHLADPSDRLRTELLHIAENVSPLAGALPAPDLHEFLIARLHQNADRLEARITRLQDDIENAKRDEDLRRERQPLLAALPAANEVLKLVRYENMLDRHLHRALSRLTPQSEPRPSGTDQAPESEPASSTTDTPETTTSNSPLAQKQKGNETNPPIRSHGPTSPVPRREQTQNEPASGPISSARTHPKTATDPRTRATRAPPASSWCHTGGQGHPHHFARRPLTLSDAWPRIICVHLRSSADQFGIATPATADRSPRYERRRYDL